MPSTTVFNLAGEALEKLELSEQVFGVTPNMAVLHQVVVAQLVNRRQGNASTKKRSEVSGGNKKPYKQKGTGRARQGSTRSPQFRGGGSVFGPRPHPYHHDVPKKMRRLAIRSALSDKVASESLIVVDDLSLETPRTKDMLNILDKLPTIEGKKVLMMLPRRDENVILSSRNIPTAKVQHVSSINVVELLKHDYIVMPVQTVRWIELVFGEGISAEEASLKIAADAAEREAPEVTETPETPVSEALEVVETPETPVSEAPEVAETPETPASEASDAAETPETPASENEA
jgi:large subunit ribosomal protein L4